MIVLDGATGEGGGQVLRSALSLSLVTGQAFRINGIRAQRERPGLRRQHLCAVQAAAQVGRARVKGAELGSRRLTFRPGRITPGEYTFSIGTAGSVCLVLQTVLPPLLTAEGPSRLSLEGGTHNPLAPSFDFLERVFLPLIRRMGPGVVSRLERPGFYPAGGGRCTVEITPVPTLQPLTLLERGELVAGRARVLLARLPSHIAERELEVVAHRLGWPRSRFEAVTLTPAPGPGNALLLELECEQITELIAGIGEKGRPAELVAEQAVREAETYLAAGVPVGTHLADQLLLPLALAGGGRFRTLTPSLHTLTNLEVLGSFLDLEVSLAELGHGSVELALTCQGPSRSDA